MKKLGFVAAALCGAVLAGCGEGSDRLRVAYVTNGVDPFWDVASGGAYAAAEEFGVDVEIRMPTEGLAEQQRMVEGLIARGIDGIAISPIDAAGQIDFLNDACGKTNLITHDSDAPGSRRLCFIGMNNYVAGRSAGKLVKEVLPEGGKIMIFVGRLEQLNAQQRRQGVIDELLGRDEQELDSIEYSAVDAELKNEKYAIVGTRTDDFDYAKAKRNAEDAMAKYPDLACMVGLFAYNTPMCLEAVKQAGKVGKIKLVSFDEQDATLQGIKDGAVHATVSQWPYNYGYHSVRILTALAKGDKSVLPEGGYLETKLRIAKKDNVDVFWKELKELQKTKK